MYNCTYLYLKSANDFSAFLFQTLYISNNFNSSKKKITEEIAHVALKYHITSVKCPEKKLRFLKKYFSNEQK